MSELRNATLGRQPPPPRYPSPPPASIAAGSERLKPSCSNSRQTVQYAPARFTETRVYTHSEVKYSSCVSEYGNQDRGEEQGVGSCSRVARGLVPPLSAALTTLRMVFGDQSCFTGARSGKLDLEPASTVAYFPVPPDQALFRLHHSTKI